jgi:hypothetical protein
VQGQRNTRQQHEFKREDREQRSFQCFEILGFQSDDVDCWPSLKATNSELRL